MKPHFSGRKRNAPPRRKAKSASKKGAPGAAGRTGAASTSRAAAARGAARQRYQAPSEPVFSMSTVFLLVVALGIAAIMAMLMLPRDLSFIQGYPYKAKGTPENLLTEAQESLVKRDAEVVFTEEEVNQYLNARLKGSQGGAFSSFVNFEAVYVDFEKDSSEIYMVRKVFGMPMTISLSMSLKNLQSQFIWRGEGGSIGHFKMKKYQFQPIIAAFKNMASAGQGEIEVLNQMGDIRFEDDKIVLDPKF